MTTQDFQRYLEQPRLLYDLPLASLQQLAMLYPYSPNLRLLLLLKSHLDGHPNEADYLSRCAAASFDRAFIYDLLKDTGQVTTAPDQIEEVLELKTLDDLALEVAALPSEAALLATDENLRYANIFPDTFEEEGSNVPLPTHDTAFDATEEPLPTAEPSTESTILTAPALPLVPAAWATTAAAFYNVLPDWPTTPPKSAKSSAPSPEPISHFQSSRPAAGEGRLLDRLRDIRRQQAGKLADEQEEIRKIARRSLVTQEAVASETLAQLFVRQGQYQNAIKMYHRLELLYPDKKTIFVGLIKDLKEKL
jgi:tetratricopeptide (TPR) repeat protein